MRIYREVLTAIISDQSYTFLAELNADYTQICFNTQDILSFFLAQKEEDSIDNEIRYDSYIIDFGSRTIASLALLCASESIDRESERGTAYGEAMKEFCYSLRIRSNKSRILIVERALTIGDQWSLDLDQFDKRKNPFIEEWSTSYWYFIQSRLIDGDIVSTVSADCLNVGFKRNELLSWLRTDTFLNYRNAEQVSSLFKRELGIMSSRPYKLIALDLDNTIWDGILREDGPHGITVGGISNRGKFYYEFQKLWLFLQNRGILLAVVSKNNEQDIKDIIREKEMPLKEECFVDIRGSDRPKSHLIKEIACTLNISTRDILFVDDSRREQLEVLHGLGSENISVAQLDEDPLSWIECLMLDARFLKTIRSVSFTEKSDRTRQYIKRRERLEDKHSYSSDIGFVSWVKSLNQVVSANIVDKPSERALELFSRVNQFNSRGKKLSKKDLIDMADNGFVFCEFSVCDKYNNDGVVSVVTLKLENDRLVVRDFLLSCRAFGRMIESIIVDFLLRYAQEKGRDLVFIEYEVLETNKSSSSFLRSVTREGVLEDVRVEETLKISL